MTTTSSLSVFVTLLALCCAVASVRVTTRVPQHHGHASEHVRRVYPQADVNTTYISVTVTADGTSATVQEGINKTATAFGYWSDGLNVTGWGRLGIETNSQYSDHDQVYSAGYLEGYTAWQRIFEHYTNTVYSLFGKGGIGSAPKAVQEYWTAQLAWLTSNALTQQSTDPYWYQVSLTLAQLNGLTAGFNEGNTAQLSLTVADLYVLNMVGDMGDVVQALVPSARPQWDRMSRDEMETVAMTRTHCSALIKLTGNYSTMYAAHTTWFSYATMNRAFKTIKLNLSSENGTKSKSLSFSSYPGELNSQDDFYVLDTGLTVIETTNDIFNQSLYQHVVPATVPTWIRVIVANRIATHGKEWTETFAKYNSGTYNNQWMVLNYNLFTPGQPLKPDTLWILEQIPGYTETADVTPQLERGYWPSYNIPYFPNIWTISGYPSMVAKSGPEGGNFWTYQLCPRAQIFRRDQDKVVDWTTMKAIMRYNNWRNDPYSEGSPANAIASRYDLKPSTTAIADGATDTKITDQDLRRSLEIWAISSQTYEQQPVFVWSEAKLSKEYSHIGLPDKWDFPWFLMSPQ